MTGLKDDTHFLWFFTFSDKVPSLVQIWTWELAPTGSFFAYDISSPPHFNH